MILLGDIYSKERKKNENKMIQSGMNFVKDSFSSIFVSIEKRREIVANEKKDDVLNFIRESKGATINEISDKFNIPLDVSLLILEKLEDENKITLVGKR